MGQRVAVLGLLLALALRSTAVAQEPSPAATPVYAPEDMAAMLPAHIGDLTMNVTAGTGSDPAVQGRGIGILQRLLMPFERESGDLRIGRTSGSQSIEPPVIHGVRGGIIEESDGVRDEATEATGQFFAFLDVNAFRLDGVSAESMLRSYISMMLEDPLMLKLDFAMESRDVDGKRVLIVTIGEEPGWTFLYPKGEVLFVGSDFTGQMGVTIEDVLAELP